MENLKRGLNEYEEENKMLNSLHKELKKKKVPEEDKKNQPSDLIRIDGKSTYMTPIDFISPFPAHFLSFRQLFYEDLQNIPNRAKTLTSAFLTTFCYEPSFIQPLLMNNIKVCLVSHSRSQSFEKVSENFVIISPKLKDNWGSFHAKIFLLKFPNRLRVVVTSANLIKCDWSLIGQCIWFQDFFPGRTQNDFFQSQLQSFIDEIVPKKYDLKQELGIDLKEYNFDDASVEIVVSVPGRHKNCDQFGLGRVKNVLKKEKFSDCLYQCSSIGNISAGFKADICKSFTNNSKAQFDIVFPSFRAVNESHLGPNGAGVFFLQEKNFLGNDFLKNSLCNLRSPNNYDIISGHLSHSKVFIAHNAYEIGDNTVIYLGSHNLSAAAWGKFEKNGTQICINNFEIGVLFVAKEGSKEYKQEIINRLPFGIPPLKYDSDDRPWFINTDMH